LRRNNRRECRKLIKKIRAENFPNMESEMDIQIHECQRTSGRLNIKRSSLKHIVIKLTKVKTRKI
jgi:hypothetical protein